MKFQSLAISSLLLLGSVPVAFAAQTTAHHAATPAAKDMAKVNPSYQLRVSGAVKTQKTFNVAALKQLTARNSGPMDVVCASGQVKDKANNYRGVLLTDVLDAAVIDQKAHKDDRRMVIVARATDGYTVTFSWSELYNSEIGKQVLVAWEKDGKPLSVGEGQMLLISGKDIKTGPRHVRNLSALEVVRMK